MIPVGTMADSQNPPQVDPILEELGSSRALVLVGFRASRQCEFEAELVIQVLVLLILSFWVSYYLKVRRIRSVHETIIGLFAGRSTPGLCPALLETTIANAPVGIGMFVGFIVRLTPGVVIQSMISFKSSILLNVLLPPIILSSGYQLKQVRGAPFSCRHSGN
jgi:solute carrier family 9 (sodium/hydrogen exchanger), member 6/7